jgi:hypothetical protein
MQKTQNPVQRKGHDDHQKVTLEEIVEGNALEKETEAE